MILSQPFPAYSSRRQILLYTFYAGVTVFLILLLFKPFGFKAASTILLIRNAAVYGAATFFMAAANSLLLPQVLPDTFREERWTVGRELVMMLWQIVSISFANIFVIYLLYNIAPTAQGLFSFLGITIAVGIFPVTLVVLLKQQILLKKYATGANHLQAQLAEETNAAVPANPQLVCFEGANKKEQFCIPLHVFRFISSADNYIKVHYLQQGRLVNTVLRSSLKKAEAAVQQYPQLFRCHRTYLVNLASVEQVSGNAQGYKLHLKDVAEPVPVSRSLNNDLADHIQKYAAASR